MQTTLLGLAISFIVALTAALVGPHFIDWNTFRPQFEAEASRVLGTSVRVDGQLNAQLLPAPSLALNGIVVGGANDPGKFRADKLDVEFSLGALMRGEWRATELTINGLSVDMGFDRSGRVDFPIMTDSINLGTLTVDRLNVTGRVALHDAASRSTTEFSDIVFSGDVRALASSMRGSGNFSLSGQRYPFRVSSGPTGDNQGTRVHFNIDPAQTPMSVDVDGVLNFDQRVPRFEGGLIVARVVNAKAADDKAADSQAVVQPWRLTARLNADPSAARLEQVDVSYGPDEAALKLGGRIDVTFGLFPALRAKLSARPFDADRLWRLNPGFEQSSLLPQVTAVLAGMPAPPLKSRIEVGAEQIMLGGRPVQKFEADLRSDGAAWSLQRLDLRAPGSTRLVLAGELVEPGDFKGTVSLDSADPETLTGWLQGRNEPGARNPQPLRVRGQVTAGAGKVTIDPLRGDVDGSTLDGRVMVADVGADTGGRVEAELRADRLDIDAFAALLRGFAGSKKDWPTRAQVALDIGTAISAGQELKPFIAAFRYSPEAISLDRFRVGEPSGLMLDGDGAFNRLNASGKLSMTARSASLGNIAKLLKPLAPDFAGRLEPVANEPGQVDLKLGLDINKAASKSDETAARLMLDIAAPQLSGKIDLGANVATEALNKFDLATVIQSRLRASADLTSRNGQHLVSLLGLERWIAGGGGPLRFEGQASGRLQAPLDVSAKLTGSAVDGGVIGKLDLMANEPKLDLALSVREADVSPMLGLAPADHSHPIRGAAKVSLVGGKLSFNEIDSSVAGARLRGNVSIQSGTERSVDGNVDLDMLEVSPLVTALLGVTPGDSSRPLDPALGSGWRGQLGIKAARAVLPGELDARPFSGVLIGSGASVSLTKMKGGLAGGEASGDITIRQGADGVTLDVRAALDNADGAQLRYKSLAMPGGKVSLKLALASTGRSAAALEGAVAGEGVLTIADAKVAGLDPQVFDAALAAVEGQPGVRLSEDKLRDLVEWQMQKGTWSAKLVQAPFVAKDGRIRVSAVSIDGGASTATLSGGYDIPGGQYDLRVSVIGKPPAYPGNPEVLALIGGVPAKASTTVDISGLSSWLAVRAIERETQRLEALQREEALATATKTTAPDARLEPTPAAVVPPVPAIPNEKVPATPEKTSERPADQAPPAGSDRHDQAGLTPDLGIVNPPLPVADPRRMPPAHHADMPADRSDADTLFSAPTVNGRLTPLPAPIEIRPAPGAGNTPRPRPATPMVLTPSKPAGAGRSAF